MVGVSHQEKTVSQRISGLSCLFQNSCDQETEIGTGQTTVYGWEV